jgi:two-component system, NarL family, invasion response regulator UvrY
VVRVLLVDDQAPFRAAARLVIARTSDFELVGEAASGAEAVEQTGDLRPDLVLMDVYLGDRNGVDVTREITSADEAPYVLLLSTHALEDLPPDARRCGAGGYINKEQFSPRVLRTMWEHRGEDGFDTV